MESRARLKRVYLSGFLLAAHYALVIYLNSSLLREFASDSTISYLYAIGSIASIITLLLTPFFLRKYGNTLTLLAFTGLEIIAVFGIGSSTMAAAIFALFVLHQAAESILFFCLDVQLEHEMETEKRTGERRGMLFAIQNIAWVLSPLLLSFIVPDGDFNNVYFLSGLMLVLLFFVALKFPNIKTTRLNGSNIRAGIRAFFSGGDITRIVLIQYLLNFFYAWMIIYLPLTLNIEVGFGWDQIGLIISIMLLPFLIFELPAGIIADRKIGEKELLIVGLSIMSIATFFIPFLDKPKFWVWAAVLFATRVGASLTEISSETYFFKHVIDKDTGLISIFRIARPFSLLIVPFIALFVLKFVDYSSSFAFLSFIVALGLLFVPKVDTK